MDKVRRDSRAGILATASTFVCSRGFRATASLVGATVLVGGAVYGTYRVGVKASEVAKRVKRWWTNEPDPVAPAPSEVAAVYEPESARPGSEERALSPPKCQALVGYMEGGVFCILGNAARIDDWLVIPDHVKSAKPDHLELRSFDQKQRLELSEDLLSAMEVVDTDLLAVQLSQAQWSRIGLSKSSLLPGIPEHQGVYVSVVGAFGKGTTGILSHHAVFGRVHYTGSTYQGYSGALYMSGDRIAGIHTHGGSFNGGYSASYALCLLKFFRKKKEAGDGRIHYEESADWLKQQYDAGAEVEHDSKWQDLDEVRIRVRGRYHIVSRDTMGQVFGNKWQAKLSKRGHKGHWIDEELAGEARASLSGASDSPTKTAPLDLDVQNYPSPSALRRLARKLQAVRAPSRTPSQERSS